VSAEQSLPPKMGLPTHEFQEQGIDVFGLLLSFMDNLPMSSLTCNDLELTHIFQYETFETLKMKDARRKYRVLHISICEKGPHLCHIYVPDI
jgi:hypothetical protein